MSFLAVPDLHLLMWKIEYKRTLHMIAGGSKGNDGCGQTPWHSIQHALYLLPAYLWTAGCCIIGCSSWKQTCSTQFLNDSSQVFTSARCSFCYGCWRGYLGTSLRAWLCTVWTCWGRKVLCGTPLKNRKWEQEVNHSILILWIDRYRAFGRMKQWDVVTSYT